MRKKRKTHKFLSSVNLRRRSGFRWLLQNTGKQPDRAVEQQVGRTLNADSGSSSNSGISRSHLCATRRAGSKHEELKKERVSVLRRFARCCCRRFAATGGALPDGNPEENNSSQSTRAAKKGRWMRSQDHSKVCAQVFSSADGIRSTIAAKCFRQQTRSQLRKHTSKTQFFFFSFSPATSRQELNVSTNSIGNHSDYHRKVPL